jgi:DNA-binding LytR/AlgR family response regulator
MRVIIIEDEIPAANRLCKMLQGMDPAISITGRYDSIESSVRFFRSGDTAFDLVFMDIFSFG